MIRRAGVAFGLFALILASPQPPAVACESGRTPGAASHATESMRPHPNPLPEGEGATAIELRDHSDGDRFVCRLRLDETGTFTLAFTHSMYGGAVAETYRVALDPARLQRSAIHTELAAAAEYYARYGEFQQDGEMWQVAASPWDTPSLHVRVDRVGSPRLALGNRTIELLDLVPDGHVVTLVAAEAQ